MCNAEDSTAPRRNNDVIIVIVVVGGVVVDRFYIALFSTLEQTHCARM